MRDFWLPTILAALIVIGAILGTFLYFQQKERISRERCAQGWVWECPGPTP